MGLLQVPSITQIGALRFCRYKHARDRAYFSDVCWEAGCTNAVCPTDASCVEAGVCEAHGDAIRAGRLKVSTRPPADLKRAAQKHRFLLHYYVVAQLVRECDFVANELLPVRGLHCLR